MDDFALESHIISLLGLFFPKVPGQELHRRHSANEPAWHGILGWQRIADELQLPKLCCFLRKKLTNLVDIFNSINSLIFFNY